MDLSVKLIATWIVGGLFLLFGVWVVQNLEFNIGVSELSYYLALLVALIFFLISGLCWISVAVGTKHRY